MITKEEIREEIRQMDKNKIFWEEQQKKVEYLRGSGY